MAMTVLIDTDVPPAGPAPPERGGGWRALSALRLIAGWLLVLVAVAVPLFTTTETLEEPLVDCSQSAVDILLGGADGPRAEDCRNAASSELLGAALFGGAGAGLIAGRRLRRRALARQLIDVARMEASGTWRFRPLWRWTAMVVTGLPLLVLSIVALAAGNPGLLVVGIVLGGPYAAYGYLAGFRPRVELAPTELVVVNPLRTHRVPWGDLVAVIPGYWGARLTRRDGSTVNLWAGQKSNWAVWRGRRSRSDAMCAAIAQRAQLAAGNLDPTMQLADPARPDQRRHGLRNMAIGFGVYGLFLIVRFGLMG